MSGLVLTTIQADRINYHRHHLRTNDVSSCNKSETVQRQKQYVKRNLNKCSKGKRLSPSSISIIRAQDLNNWRYTPSIYNIKQVLTRRSQGKMFSFILSNYVWALYMVQIHAHYAIISTLNSFLKRGIVLDPNLGMSSILVVCTEISILVPIMGNKIIEESWICRGKVLESCDQIFQDC